jgi:hypothetical protein
MLRAPGFPAGGMVLRKQIVTGPQGAIEHSFATRPKNDNSARISENDVELTAMSEAVCALPTRVPCFMKAMHGLSRMPNTGNGILRESGFRSFETHRSDSSTRDEIPILGIFTVRFSPN